MSDWLDEEFIYSLCDRVQYEISELERKHRLNEYSDEEEISAAFVAALVIAVREHEKNYRPQNQPIHGSGAKDPVHLEATRYGLKGRSLTHRGRMSEEIRFGADILLILESRISGHELTKGLLIQCKDNGRAKFHKTGRPDLKEQCEKMRAVTDSSFVLMYASNGFHLLPNPIENDGFDFKLHRAQALDQRSFFHDFFDCSIGDKEMNTTQKGSFMRVANRLSARRTVKIEASSE